MFETGASCCVACGMLGYCIGISLVLKIEFQGTHTHTHTLTLSHSLVVYSTTWFTLRPTRRRLQSTLCGIRVAFVYVNRNDNDADADADSDDVDLIANAPTLRSLAFDWLPLLALSQIPHQNPT